MRFTASFITVTGLLDLVCKKLDIKELSLNCDLVFLALPHTVSMTIAPKILSKGLKVIDLSADYRIKDNKTYEII